MLVFERETQSCAREVQAFARDLIESHCPGIEWPDLLGSVRLGERFVRLGRILAAPPL